MLVKGLRQDVSTSLITGKKLNEAGGLLKVSWPAKLGPVVRRPISAQPGVKFNPCFSFFCSKAFSRIIFSVIFRAFNHQLVDKKN